MENKNGFSLVELLITLMILGFSSLILIQHQYQLILRQQVIEQKTIETDRKVNQFELLVAGYDSPFDQTCQELIL